VTVFQDVALLGHPGKLALKPTVLGLVIHARRLRLRIAKKLDLLVE
jgi:hypothetical protein